MKKNDTKPMGNQLTLQIDWNAKLNMSLHSGKLNIMVGKKEELLTETK